MSRHQSRKWKTNYESSEIIWRSLITTRGPLPLLFAATLASAVLATAVRAEISQVPASGPTRLEPEETAKAFEDRYHASNALEMTRNLTAESSQALIEELSNVNSKLFSATGSTRQRIALDDYVLPVSPPARKLDRWRQILPAGVTPPRVAHQTFVVSLNGKAYVVAPGHATRDDKRYFTPPKSDSAVRAATPAEAKHAILIDRRPLDFAGKIITLEGRLITGEHVRFDAAALRGGTLLQALLPDERASFTNRWRGIEVPYERTLVLVLPPEWLHAAGLKLHKATGFSGAPAIEKTPEGDAVAGHFIGHRTIKTGGKTVTLGFIEDYESIRAAVERFAASPRAELSAGEARSQ